MGVRRLGQYLGEDALGVVPPLLVDQAGRDA
jgi:hypothetical protein